MKSINIQAKDSLLQMDIEVDGSYLQKLLQRFSDGEFSIVIKDGIGEYKIFTKENEKAYTLIQLIDEFHDSCGYNAKFKFI